VNTGLKPKYLSEGAMPREAAPPSSHPSNSAPGALLFVVRVGAENCRGSGFAVGVCFGSPPIGPEERLTYFSDLLTESDSRKQGRKWL